MHTNGYSHFKYFTPVVPGLIQCHRFPRWLVSQHIFYFPRYVVYFVNDTNYGTLINNNWTGMVGDVISGAADIIAGALSVTSERMKVMDFTEPFFQNKLSIVSAEGGSSVSIWAFLSPFSGQVSLGCLSVFLSAWKSSDCPSVCLSSCLCSSVRQPVCVKICRFLPVSYRNAHHRVIQLALRFLIIVCLEIQISRSS